MKSSMKSDAKTPKVHAPRLSPRLLQRIAYVGLLIFMAGFIWGVHFVGVPYQDPTPAQRAYEAVHSSISGWLMGAGICTLLSSGSLAAAHLILNRSRDGAAR
jgi:hypothetical protein